MESAALEASNILQRFESHTNVHRVELVDGLIRILKFPREGNPEAKIRELINELVVLELLSYGGICNTPIIYSHDMGICIARDDYEYPWSIFDSDPDIKIANAEQIPLALVVDWVTGQQDRFDNKENARLQKLENDTYLFAPTDNGHSIWGTNQEFNPENNTGSDYTSRLLFSGKVNSREVLEKAIVSIGSWPIATIVINAADKVLTCGCSFSVETREFVLDYCVKVINFIN